MTVRQQAEEFVERVSGITRAEKKVWKQALYWRKKYRDVLDQLHQSRAELRSARKKRVREERREHRTEAEILAMPWRCIVPGCGADVLEGVAICARCRNAGSARSAGRRSLWL